MSTLNRIFVITNLLLFSFLLGPFSSLPVEAASSGTISACANKSSGALRISQKCTKSEQQVSWSKSGETGNVTPVKTKVVTLNYIANGDRCSQGGGTFVGFTYTLNAGSPIRFDAPRLASSSWWTLNQTCTITLKVLD